MLIGTRFDHLSLFPDKLIADGGEVASYDAHALIHPPRKSVDQRLRENDLHGKVRQLLDSRLEYLLVILNEGIVRVLQGIELAAHCSNSDNVHCNLICPMVDLSDARNVLFR
jgi:hypothetical protein